MHGQLGRLRRDAARQGTSLILDLPVGVHPDGFDARDDPSGFVGGMTLGSPPDPGFPAGQDWELPAPHPEGMRATAYRGLARAARRHFEFADTLRIDHVMGCRRLFWIPEGSPAADGTYVHYRAEEIAAVLLLEASRRGATIVGEDLGTVPPVVRRDLRRYGWLGMYVAQLEWSPAVPPGRRPRKIPIEVLALLGSHDQPTFATFWKDSISPSGRPFPPIGTPGAPPSGPHDTFLSAVRRLLESPAERVIFPLEDLWGETAPQNVPGTARTSAHNFDRVSRLSIEEIDQSPAISETLSTIARWAAEDDR
jgi:4-alpha-glucanotransferase